MMFPYALIIQSKKSLRVNYIKGKSIGKASHSPYSVLYNFIIITS